MTVKEYIDKFKDLRQFMANMLLSEENKYDWFLSGLYVTIRFGLASFKGTTYNNLVVKDLEVEKLKKKEREVFQKGRKHSQSSFYNIDNRFTKKGGSAFQDKTGTSLGRSSDTKSK